MANQTGVTVTRSVDFYVQSGNGCCQAELSFGNSQMLQEGASKTYPHSVLTIQCGLGEGHEGPHKRQAGYSPSVEKFGSIQMVDHPFTVTWPPSPLEEP